MAPSVAVFMPTFRCRRWLPDAIASVLAQTWRPLDLYVVDDASGDVDADLADRFPEVTFVRVGHRLGPYGIDNLLLSVTASDSVAFHDADDRSKPDRIAAQVELMASLGLDGCGTWSLLTDVHGDPLGYETTPRDARKALRAGVPIGMAHPSTLLSRELLDKLVGFDASTLMSADCELHLRASLYFELGNVQRFLYSRRVHPESLTQHPETGIGSQARGAYLEPIRGRYMDIVLHGAPAPADGTALNGRPIERPDPEAIEWIRVGRGNTTYQGHPARAPATAASGRA
jgi:glycosyltransferase involved in cell wall biosynthesis